MIAPSLCERKKIKKEESNKKREVKKGKAKKRLHQGEGRFVSVDVFLPTSSLSARGSSWQYRPPSLLVFFVSSHPLLHPFPATFDRVSHYNSTSHYCLIVLILQVSAAFPEIHKVLLRADLVPPGNRSSNLSQVPPVGCSSPLCAW
jgi:hypothetical protein